MYNTFADIHKIKYQLVNSILGELEEILKPDIYSKLLARQCTQCFCNKRRQRSFRMDRNSLRTLSG